MSNTAEVMANQKGVSLEVIKGLQAILAMAQRDQIASIVICGVGVDGKAIQMLTISDGYIPTINIQLDLVKTRLIERIGKFEVQERVSPILRAGPGALNG